MPAAPDGFHHPASEDQLADIVKACLPRGPAAPRPRRGPFDVARRLHRPAGLPNRVNQQSPPAGDNINVMLDRYRGWRVTDEARKLVEADAGIHLGADPGDPTGTATLETSLLYALAQKGWTLFDTGGITHQTVSGFTATASSGGSLRFSSNDNLHGVSGDRRDGRDPRVLARRRRPGPLLRDVADLRPAGRRLIDHLRVHRHLRHRRPGGGGDARGLRRRPFGDGGGGRPSLAQFLRDTDFARLEWWPQRGVDRVLTWQARRFPPGPDFQPKPYDQFGDNPEAAQHLIAILFTILGNLDDLSRAKPKLEDNFDELRGVLEARAGAPRSRRRGEALVADFLSQAIEFGVEPRSRPRALESHPLRNVPDFSRSSMLFVPLDAEQGGRPQRFQDWGWSGLPMDNRPTTSWCPPSSPRRGCRCPARAGHAAAEGVLHRAGRRTRGLRAHRHLRVGALRAMPAPFWLSPAHTSGADEWKDGALRIDPYWFADNAADPSQTFFLGLWRLLRDNDIPFRLHWGKFQPIYARGDRSWVDFFGAQYPRWDDFLRLRAERDPNNIFLNAYWRDRFGLWDEPAPSPRQ